VCFLCIEQDHVPSVSKSFKNLELFFVHLPFTVDTPLTATASMLPSSQPVVSMALATPAIISSPPASPTQPPLQELHPQYSDDLQGASTWSERNPHKPMQPVRSRAKRTDAQKNSLKIAAARNKKARTALTVDILALTATCKTQIEELAAKHSVSVQHIEKLTNSSTHYKKLRAPNLANALAHMKASEVNEGMLTSSTPGSKLQNVCRSSRGFQAFPSGHQGRRQQRSGLSKYVRERQG
jgi:hypothetical protein